MVKVVHKKVPNPGVTLLEAETPLIMEKAKAGQFIILHLDEQGERIPPTIADYDREKGTVIIIFQRVELTTELLTELNKGDSTRGFVGPLGLLTELLERIKRICMVGRDVGCVIAYPQTKTCHTEGLEVDVIADFCSKGIAIPEDEFKSACDHLYIMIDNDSYGEQDLVTVKLRELIDDGIHYDAVVTIGPISMMKFVSKTTEPYDIKTIVSLNPIMTDGIGMYGGCRVIVGDKVKFICVDGPDFDGREMDLDELVNRNSIYHAQEAGKKERHACRMDQLAHELTDR